MSQYEIATLFLVVILAASIPQSYAAVGAVLGSCGPRDWKAGEFNDVIGTPDALSVILYEDDGLFGVLEGLFPEAYIEDQITRTGEIAAKYVAHAHIGTCEDIEAGVNIGSSTGAHWNYNTSLPYGEEINEIWWSGYTNMTMADGNLNIKDITAIRNWTLPGSSGAVPAVDIEDQVRGSKGTQGSVPGSVALHYINDDLSTGPQWACCSITYVDDLCSDGSCTVYKSSSEAIIAAPIQILPSEIPEEAPEAAIPQDSIAGVAIATPALSTLVAAVTAADLVGLFVDPTDTYTVLAPTNEAFADLLAALGANGLEDIPLETLTEVLAYHVIPSAAIFSTDLVDGAVVTTLGGAELTVDLTSAPGSVIFDGIGSDATVVIADVEAGDSVVHVIDAVLLPFSPAPPPARFCRPRGFGCRLDEQCCSGTCRRAGFFFRACASSR